jgi:hypothetical protein
LKVRNSPWLVKTQPWFCCPLQSQIATGVPAAGLLPTTSRHRPDAALISGLPTAADALPTPSHTAPPLAAITAAASTILHRMTFSFWVSWGVHPVRLVGL